MPKKKQLPARVEAEIVEEPDIDEISPYPKLKLTNRKLVAGLQEWYDTEHKFESYADFKKYVAHVMNAVRLNLMDRQTANAQIYAGSMLLLALDREREFGDPSSQLPEGMRDAPIDVELTVEEMRELLQTQSQTVQIKILRKKYEEGRIIEGEVTEYKTLECKDKEPIPAADFEQKAKDLLSMVMGTTGGAQDEEEWF